MSSAKAVLASAQKRALLEVLLREEANAQAPRSRRSPMGLVAREHALRLSYAQERLWFLDQLFPDSHLYNIPAAIRLQGSLNEAALAESLREIVRRHESLRTTFTAQDGPPEQIISLDTRITLPLTDLSHLPEGEREQEAVRLATEQAHSPFDLERGPLMRVGLLRLDAEDHVLLLTLHHIISDGWSLGVLFSEFGSLYESFSRGEEAHLSELPVQYADYAAWQREWLSAETLERQFVYWREQLGGKLPVLELPTDRARTAVQSHHGARRSIALSAALTRRLKELSRREGVTLYMTLLAAFQTLLHRYAGQTDILVGCPVAGRTRTEIEGLIGFFVNTLVMRTDLSGDPTFAELLQRVKQVTLGAFDRQDIPFEKLVEELHAERSMDHAPLTQVMFSLQNDPMRALHLADLKLSTLAIASDTAKFDLTLAMSETGDGLAAVLEYDCDLFEPATAERMLVHLEQLLTCAASSPERRLSALQLLTANESRQLLVEFNDTAAEYRRDSSIHQLFEEQAAAAPDTVAVVFNDRQVSYRELNAQANQLAHHLHSLGAGPEVLVGVCVERSVEMVVALLAVLKSGSAYVPLDPAYPRERLSFMLSDTGIKIMLTQSHLLAALPPHQAQVICLDADWGLISEQSRENPSSVVGAEHLAYVMYTSGSTGRPKGVGIPHRGVVRLVKGNDYISFTAEDVFLQLAPISFDAATFEVWGSLLNGARLVVMSAGQPTLEQLGGVIAAQGVTTLWLTSGLFHLMVDEQLDQLVQVRQLLAGGDVLSVSHVEKYLAALRRANSETGRLINGYGPTENTTFSSGYAMTGETEVGARVPIGKPIRNTTIYLLDQGMKPVPVGVNGEVYLGGDGLARGYLNRPALTAEKFVPDPCGSAFGGRLYRTGDVARYLPDGSIEFIGRMDQQVKIRGYRVELGEIEAVASGHEGVREVVVVAREDLPGDKRLVGYVVAEAATNGGSNGFAAQLRGYLKERLPPYMVPSTFMLLDEIPLTPNGKVDWQSLPSPEEGGAEREADYVAPTNETEKIIAGVWQEALRVEKVGANDNFFDIGGNSLLLIRVRSKLKELLRKEIPVIEMFNHPTVSALAGYLGEEQAAPDSSARQGAERAATRRKLMRQHGQARRV